MSTGSAARRRRLTSDKASVSRPCPLVLVDAAPLPTRLNNFLWKHILYVCVDVGQRLLVITNACRSSKYRQMFKTVLVAFLLFWLHLVEPVDATLCRLWSEYGCGERNPQHNDVHLPQHFKDPTVWKSFACDGDSKACTGTGTPCAGCNDKVKAGSCGTLHPYHFCLQAA